MPLLLLKSFVSCLESRVAMSLSVLYRFYTKFVLLFRDSAVSIQQLRVVCSHFRSVQTSPLLKNRRKRKMSVSHRPLSDFFLRGWRLYTACVFCRCVKAVSHVGILHFNTGPVKVILASRLNYIKNGILKICHKA